MCELVVVDGVVAAVAAVVAAAVCLFLDGAVVVPCPSFHCCLAPRRVQGWAQGVPTVRVRFDAAESALALSIDPVTLELCRPHLVAAARASHDGASLVLSALLLAPLPPLAVPVLLTDAAATNPTEVQGAAGGGGGGDSAVSDPGYLQASPNVLALAPPARRFALLPIAKDTAHHDPTAGSGGAGAGDLSGGAMGDLADRGRRSAGGKALDHPDGGQDADGSTGGFSLLGNLRFKW